MSSDNNRENLRDELQGELDCLLHRIRVLGYTAKTPGGIWIGDVDVCHKHCDCCGGDLENDEDGVCDLCSTATTGK